MSTSESLTGQPENTPATPMSGVTADFPPPIARGEAYQRTLQKFLTQGQLSSQGTNYTIIKKLVYTGTKNFFEYAIGCYRCGQLSWNWDDVNIRYCPNCHVFHDAS